MNTSKIIKPSVATGSKIPTIKRPTPVTVTPTTTTNKVTKPVPTITSQPKTPHKTAQDSASKSNDTKAQPPTTTNKENKENLSLNSTKKAQDVKVKGYTELKKNEERLSELVNKFEVEKQNHAQQIAALEQKHKEELRAKDEIIRSLKYELEASHNRTHKAENELSALQEDIANVTAKNKSLESLLEEFNVDVVALEKIPVAINIAEIESRFQEFKEAFERDHEACLRSTKIRAELLECMGRVEIYIPELIEDEDEIMDENEPLQIEAESTSSPVFTSFSCSSQNSQLTDVVGVGTFNASATHFGSGVIVD